METVKTPCIGICTTTSVGDFVCRGCKRYSFEVINWNSFSEPEKTAVLTRLEQLSCQIIENKLRIFSVEKLRQLLVQWRVPYDETLSSYCWLQNLLKKYPHKIESLEDCGVVRRPAFESLSVAQLCATIESELLVLSEAHFARYFNTARRAANVMGTVAD